MIDKTKLNPILAEYKAYFPSHWYNDNEYWKDYDVESIINRVVNNKDLEKGSIILKHNSAKYTLDALKVIIVGLQNKGYEFVPIS